MPNEPVNRKLKISILRFNPREQGSHPRMQAYEIDEAENMGWLQRFFLNVAPF